MPVVGLDELGQQPQMLVKLLDELGVLLIAQLALSASNCVASIPA